MCLPGGFGEPAKDTVAFAKRGVAWARDHENAWGGSVPVPFKRAGKQIAIRVRACDLQHANRRELVRVAIRLVPLAEMSVGLKLLEQALEIDACRALDAKSLGNVAFRGEGRVVGNPFQDFLFCGYAHGPPLARAARGVTGFGGFAPVASKLAPPPGYFQPKEGACRARSAAVSTSSSVATMAIR